MIRQQRIALRQPCEVAEQCYHDRYRSVFRKGKYLISVILTLNVGEE